MHARGIVLISVSEVLMADGKWVMTDEDAKRVDLR